MTDRDPDPATGPATDDPRAAEFWKQLQESGRTEYSAPANLKPVAVLAVNMQRVYVFGSGGAGAPFSGVISYQAAYTRMVLNPYDGSARELVWATAESSSLEMIERWIDKCLVSNDTITLVEHAERAAAMRRAGAAGTPPTHLRSVNGTQSGSNGGGDN